MPSFVDWQQKYKALGLQIVGVSMDDDERDARNTYDMYRLDYPVVMGDARLGLQYGGVLGLPVTYLIDRHGMIRYRHEGITDLKVLEREVTTLLHSASH
jgi:peroxiredoxin